MTDFRALCAELATLAKREHYYCEDSWYSCPKAEDKCANDSEGEDCNCGADIHNAKVEAIAVLAKYGTPTPTPPAALAQPKPVAPTDEELWALTAPTLMERAMAGDVIAAKQFLYEANFIDEHGQWLPQYQPIPDEQ